MLGAFVKLNFALFAVLLSLLLQGCMTANQADDRPTNIMIAEPLAINPQSEIALARLTEILARVEVSDEQKAKLFYDRGVIYDSVGLRGLASYDFQRALHLQPDLVDAYNFMGILYTQRQEFLMAYEAFDSAIELEPDHQYAYLNRGIALYYGGRPILAAKDLNKFQTQQKNDPYRIAWVYLIEQQVDSVMAKQNLQQNIENLTHSSWGNNILRLFSGELSEKQFINGLAQGVKSKKELTDRLCEAYFYLGKYHLINHKPKQSSNYFKLALATNVYEFIEHRYAKLELDLLQASFAPVSN